VAATMIELPGSFKAPYAKGVPVAHPTEDNITILLTLNRTHGNKIAHAETSENISRGKFLEHYGANPSDVASVLHYLDTKGFVIQKVNVQARVIKFSGPLDAVCKAFGVKVSYYGDPKTGLVHRVREGSIFISEELNGLVSGVFGFDDRPIAHKIRPHSENQSYSPEQVASIYSFPMTSKGKGQVIGILELGGGYKDKDLEEYWKKQNLSNVKVIAYDVDGAQSNPSDTESSGEVILDIEVIGAIAPAATVVVFFAPNTDAGYIDCLSTMIHNPTYKINIGSISWGSYESAWTSQSLSAINSFFEDAKALGITFCAASGDNGADDGAGDGSPHVDFPASNPYVLGCGGTTLTSLEQEKVWNESPDGGASGGGFSSIYGTPDYQKSIPACKMRGVPDVAGNADPETGYETSLGVIGGTSAVAPLWSALIALLNAQLGKSLGFLHTFLYANPSAFHDITEGNNTYGGAQGYSATPGWDACTGLGSPNGEKLLALLKESTK